MDVRDDDPGTDSHRLAPLTTLRLGGPAREIVRADDEQQITHIVRATDRSHGNLLVLAGGSNVVIGDDGFDGTALVLATAGASAARDGEDVLVTVAAGEPWDAFVARAIAEKWSGVESLSGVPGSAGATPIQNVGAYGQEIAERVVSVRVLDRRTGEVVVMSAAECGFGYRTSIFKHATRWIVLSVTLRLAISPRSAPIRYAELAGRLGVSVGERADTTDVRESVLDLRRGKGMVLDPADPDTYSVGSFFTNPVLTAGDYAALIERAGDGERVAAWPEPDGGAKISAAWLIQHTGFPKGYAHGNVAISGKHTLALTNRGDGTTAELLDLAREIRAGVHVRFGVMLRPEPVLINCAL